MHFLLTNDDGFDAPGLAALLEAASSWGRVTVVASRLPWSGCGHQTTTNEPIYVECVRADRYVISGTPADCVRLALTQLTPDVDWVLSGVNDGGNLGVDTYMSGTVAAAREAMLLGKHAVAFSQYRKQRQEPDWSRATELVRSVLPLLFNAPPLAGSFWNVNFPDQDPALEAAYSPPRIAECPLDPHPLPVDFEIHAGAYHYRSNYHSRPRLPGGDVDACFSGQITLTRIVHHAR